MIAEIALLCAGFGIVVLGVFAGLGRLPRNYWAGIRVGSVMASGAARAAGHRASSRWIFGSGAVGAAGAILALTHPDHSGVWTMLASLGLLVLLLIATAVASRAARKQMQSPTAG